MVRGPPPRWRPAVWHPGLMRASLARAVNKSLSAEPFHIVASFRKLLMKAYELRDVSDPQSPCWNITTGALEPIRRVKTSADHLQATTIAPRILGKPLFKHVFGNNHHHFDFWGPGNGLMLPAALGTALEEWALSIVPDIPDESTPQQVSAWARAHVKEWKWRVLDPSHDMLAAGKRITLAPGDDRSGVDLHGQRLLFPPHCKKRPTVAYVYFVHCSAVLARYRWLFEDNVGLVSLLRKQARGENVTEEKQQMAQDELALWDAKAALQTGPVMSMTDFWVEVMEDLHALNNGKATAAVEALDWRMTGSKYLPGATDVADSPHDGDASDGDASDGGESEATGDEVEARVV